MGRGMVRGVPRPPGNVRPMGPNVRPGLRPSGSNNGSIRPNMARPGGPININNGPRPANGVRPNFAQQPRMNNGSVRPNNPAQRPPNFNKPAPQQDKDDENSNDSTSQPLPSFGNTWGSNFSNN